MDEFLVSYLKLSDFNITYFNGGKDNITAKIDVQGNSFVIQKTLLLEKNLQESITHSIRIYRKNNLGFAKSYGDTRFIDFKNNTYSLMEYLPGEIIRDKSHSGDLMLKISKYLAHIHNTSEKENLSTYNPGSGKHKNLEKFIDLAQKYNKKNSTYSSLLDELIQKVSGLKRNHHVRVGLIHGDPAFKNFIMNNDGNILGIIDYEMMEKDDFLWDLVDMVRSHMKLEWFQKREFWNLIDSYESVRPLTREEKENLESYLKMMILNTGSRYFLSLFAESEYSNHLGDQTDSINKLKRCFSEYEKAQLFFK